MTQSGKVLPFGLSAWRLRRGADRQRQRGRSEDAVALLRRAAEQENSPAGWIALAAQLRTLGCYEQALQVLRRVAAGSDFPCEAWLEMARCQAALQEDEGAVDCLCRYLNEDPYSAAADEARMMLSQLEQPDERRDALRLHQLGRRGFAAWLAGDEELGMRRLERAMRMAENPAGLYVSVAVRLMTLRRCGEAVRYLAAAVDIEPEDPRAACMLCAALHGAGKPRMARGLLRQYMPRCMNPVGENVFCTTAELLGAQTELEEYLRARLAAQPCRVTLMHRMADMLIGRGDVEQAKGWWQRILHLDPADVRALLMLRYLARHEQTPPQGYWPVELIRDCWLQLLLMRHDENCVVSLEEGSDDRLLLDFAMQQHDEGMQRCAVELASRRDSPESRRYLREQLMNVALSPNTRARIMLHLTQVGESGNMQTLMGQRVTTMSCTPVRNRPGSMWRMFLMRLLSVSARHRQSEAIASLSAGVWPLLSPEEKRRSVGRDAYCWAKAFELLYLRMTGQEAAAARVVRRLDVSIRKVSRILRTIGARMEAEEIK